MPLKIPLRWLSGSKLGLTPCQLAWFSAKHRNLFDLACMSHSSWCLKAIVPFLKSHFRKRHTCGKKGEGEKLQRRKRRGKTPKKKGRKSRHIFWPRKKTEKKTRRIIEDNNEEEKDPFACCGCSRFGIGAEVHPRSSKHARHVESDPISPHSRKF